MKSNLQMMVLVLAVAMFGGTRAAMAQSTKPSAKAPAAKAMTASGKVKSLGDAMLVLDAAGKDMTFKLDDKTKVIARGAGTKSKTMGGKAQVTAFVHAGDSV